MECCRRKTGAITRAGKLTACLLGVVLNFFASALDVLARAFHGPAAREGERTKQDGDKGNKGEFGGSFHDGLWIIFGSLDRQSLGRPVPGKEPQLLAF